MTVLKYVLLAMLVAIGLVILFAARRPNTFRVARTKRIAAPPDAVYSEVVDLERMNTWNPFALRETGGKATYSGPAAGPGARHDFSGPKSGSGHIAIVSAEPPLRVTLRLVMTKPFQADNTIEFTIAAVDGGSDVTWQMSGRQPLLAKCMTLFVDCDRMVGREFDEGLANLDRKIGARA